MTTRFQNRPSDDVGGRIVQFALRAPSVHNTQPWTWRIDDRRLDLYADRSRQLPATDLDGRNLVISCGAALHYAVAGAAADGWMAAIDLLPDPDNPDHLATLHLSPRPPTRSDAAHAELLASRNTDRRRFIAWPVPRPLLDGLAGASGHGAATAVCVTGPAARLRVELLISRAMSVEGADPRIVAEQAHWADNVARIHADGIPPGNARPPATDHLRPLRPSRFDDLGGDADLAARVVALPGDGLLVLLTRQDQTASWLDAGDTLCRLWAGAMEHGLSVIPVSQIIEVPETRDALQHGVLEDDRHPVLLLRVGWQGLSRSPLPTTPRRPIEDVLRP